MVLELLKQFPRTGLSLISVVFCKKSVMICNSRDCERWYPQQSRLFIFCCYTLVCNPVVWLVKSKWKDAIVFGFAWLKDGWTTKVWVQTLAVPTITDHRWLLAKYNTWLQVQDIRKRRTEYRYLFSLTMGEDSFLKFLEMENFTRKGKGTDNQESTVFQSIAVFFAAVNIFVSFTASLCNILILVALHKVSSVHSPTNLLFDVWQSLMFASVLLCNPFISSVTYWLLRLL